MGLAYNPKSQTGADVNYITNSSTDHAFIYAYADPDNTGTTHQVLTELSPHGSIKQAGGAAW